MKNILFCTMAAAVMAACSSTPTLMEYTQKGEPISPIYITGDTTQLILTDYVPMTDDWSKMEISDAYTLGPVSDGELSIIRKDNALGYLNLTNGKTTVSIPILPQKAYATGLTTLKAGDDFVSFCLPIGKELQFEAFIQNVILPKEAFSFDETTMSYTLQIRKQDLPFSLEGRTYLRIFAAAEDCFFNDALIPLENGRPITDPAQLNRHDPQAQVLYSLMVDRFMNGDTLNDAPLNRSDVDPRVDYMGGDFKGITQKIQDGFFDSLGITTIWISPITQNPTTPWGHWLNPDTKFSGYHGYWPIFNTQIDNRFGDDASLREMLSTAHAHNMNVILDYVANHMHIESPTLQEHPDWITDSILPDGRRNFELWDEARLTTWFDVHIPTLDLERNEVCDAMTDTALYWVNNYDFDGYRHDACKHIPLNYWRMFTHKMKSQHPDRSLWMIGETYGNPELISSYVKTGMLNAQFDFNVYHTAIDVFGKPDHSMKEIANVIMEGQRIYGSHHTMGNISGNHDKTRFISLAGGAVRWDENDKAAGWTRQINVTADGDPEREALAFKKALLLEVLNLTIPGVPCIYQGDEYGQCGANDPDNRRMMRFSGLTDNEKRMRNEVNALIRFRRQSMPLLYGDYVERFCNDSVLLFTRTYMGETVVVGINNSDKEWVSDCGNITIPANSFILRNKTPNCGSECKKECASKCKN